jgi:hypothetical protein
MKTVADQFADSCCCRVNRVYGIVGDSLDGLTDAIRRQGKIKWLHVRHEEVAAFAAGAEAHFAREGPSDSARTTSNSPARASIHQLRIPRPQLVGTAHRTWVRDATTQMLNTIRKRECDNEVLASTAR